MIDLSSKYVTSYLGAQEGFLLYILESVKLSDFRGHFEDYLEGKVSL